MIMRGNEHFSDNSNGFQIRNDCFKNLIYGQ